MTRLPHPNHDMTDKVNLTDALKKYFGFDTFTRAHNTLILTLPPGPDTLQLMPTAADTSLG